MRMKELFDWLGRLADIEEQTTSRPSAIHENLNRVFAPSPLDFDGTIVRIIDADQETYSFGRVPGRLSVLAWPDTSSQPGQLEGQAIAAQLGAILTLATNRRIEVAASDLPLTMQGTNQRVFLPTNSLLDRSLGGPIDVDARERLKETLGLLYGLADSDREVIGAAIELHYTAALLFDVEPNAAYALAIAGLERLSRSYGTVPVEWVAWEHAARLDRAFADIDLTNQQINRLRDELLQDRHMRLRQTFASYVADNLPTDFWLLELEDFVPTLTMEPDGAGTFAGMAPGTPVPVTRLVPSDPAILRPRLLRSYDARSSYVHDGRRRSAMTTTVTQLVGNESAPSGPIEFAGIRAILRRLIDVEAQKRSQPKPLPSLVMMHAGNPPPQATDEVPGRGDLASSQD
jgi:hypothetical protein